MIVSLNIPDAVVARVVAGICGYHRYRERIPDPNDPEGLLTIPNPETKAAFSKRMLIEAVILWVRTWERTGAIAAAEAALDADIRAKLGIT